MRDLKKLPEQVRQRLQPHIESLATERPELDGHRGGRRGGRGAERQELGFDLVGGRRGRFLIGLPGAAEGGQDGAAVGGIRRHTCRTAG